MSNTDPLDTALDHHRAGRLAEAAALYEEILRREPRHVDALQLLGVIAFQRGEDARAAGLLRRAIELDPHQAGFHNVLGLALSRQGALQEAEACLRRALELEPSARIHTNLGTLLWRQGRLAEAAAALEEALRLDPDHAGALHALGDVRQSSGRLADAARCYRRALDLDDTLVGAWYGLGCAESARKEFAAALVCFRRALELEPGHAPARNNLGQALFNLGLVDPALDEFRAAAELVEEDVPWASIAVAIPGSPRADDRAVLEARRAWAERALPRRDPADAPRPRPLPAGERLRVGYVSSFFQDRNWMKPVWGLVNHHDRSRVEVHLFSDAAEEEVRGGYAKHPDDRYHDISGLSNEEAAARVRDAAIDVLVDLNGYSKLPRLGLMARRPAPRIVGWFGLFATTGIAAYDYLIGDAHVIHPDEEQHYCETILRVPGSYFTFEVGYPVPEVVPPPCLSRGHLTLGCLAPQYKVTDEVIATWARILAEAPGCRLVLKSARLGSEANRQHVLERFARAGVSPDRLELDGPAEHFAFLAKYGEIDVALDTFPYNGGTTTTEAIWQGVPVVAFDGDRWASRTSATILREGGLGELVADDLEGYVRLAVELATSPDTPARLAGLRRTLRERLRASSICDTARFAAAMEEIYRGIHRAHPSSKPA